MASAAPPFDPVARARDLAPLIRDAAAEAEREARLPQRVAQAMAEAGLYRVAAPRDVGGGEYDPMTQLRTIEAVAEADGAAGWNIMIGIEATGIVGAALPQASAARIFEDPRLIISGALNPLGSAQPVEGGFRIQGQWPFASGCQNSAYFHGQCIVQDGDAPARDADGQAVLREFLVPAEQFRVVQTWTVSGLRGSGSHDVAVEDVFVPHELTTAVTSEALVAQGPLYRMPLLTRLAYNKVGVSTGIARAAIDHFVALAGEKTPRASGRLLRERAIAQLAVADAEATLRSGRAFVFEALSGVWAAMLAGREIEIEERALLQLACTHAAEAAMKAVQTVHSAAGSTANFTWSPLERCFRDVHVVPQQIMVAPSWREPVGRVLLGLDSGSPLL